MNPTQIQTDVPDPIAKVRLIGRPDEWEDWKISHNLTDRWGDINTYSAATKPLAPLQADDEALLKRLREQMWDEITFIVRKDGQFGILFEVEHVCLESEEQWKDMCPESYAKYKPRAEIIKVLMSGVAVLAERFPGVQFCIPHEGEIIHERPAIWAFAPDGLLNDETREKLGYALLAV